MGGGWWGGGLRHWGTGLADNVAANVHPIEMKCTGSAHECTEGNQKCVFFLREIVCFRVHPIKLKCTGNGPDGPEAKCPDQKCVFFLRKIVGFAMHPHPEEICC